MSHLSGPQVKMAGKSFRVLMRVDLNRPSPESCTARISGSGVAHHHQLLGLPLISFAVPIYAPAAEIYLFLLAIPLHSSSAGRAGGGC